MRLRDPTGRGLKQCLWRSLSSRGPGSRSGYLTATVRQLTGERWAENWLMGCDWNSSRSMDPLESGWGFPTQHLCPPCYLLHLPCWSSVSAWTTPPPSRRLRCHRPAPMPPRVDRALTSPGKISHSLHLAFCTALTTLLHGNCKTLSSSYPELAVRDRAWNMTHTKRAERWHFFLE